jgi:hypothetical protein
LAPTDFAAAPTIDDLELGEPGAEGRRRSDLERGEEVGHLGLRGEPEALGRAEQLTQLVKVEPLVAGHDGEQVAAVLQHDRLGHLVRGLAGGARLLRGGHRRIVLDQRVVDALGVEVLDDRSGSRRREIGVLFGLADQWEPPLLRRPTLIRPEVGAHRDWHAQRLR